MNQNHFDLKDYLNQFFALNLNSLCSERIEKMLSVVETETDSMTEFLEALMKTDLWVSWYLVSNPYKSMIQAVGREMDDTAKIGNEPAYHSRKHTMDVCLELSRLLSHEQSNGHSADSVSLDAWTTSRHEKWLLLLAATAHDLGHSGSMNKIQYELERNSLNLLKDCLFNSGHEAELISRVMKMLEPWILATDHDQYEGLLQRLNRPQPAHEDCMAMLLVESDLASSILPKRGLELTQRLSLEWAQAYPEKSMALQTLSGYFKFLVHLRFVSPQAVKAGLPVFLNQSLLQLQSRTI